ncbi:monosaccharide ABC transporter ATP-binding protein, CUT2 family [Burkholderia sp. YR290]|uniref:sugar ABC transporter ATP-binding protein n=1 Tax=Paraburkholderia hospita TaxID=169430 RepID=UPI00027157EA|nr:sugar ABC transporter ATP-binding protein [Paraburkholderia hospita]EUC12255.1 Monosaccharide-transporting ATPase [Burkholderia sp. BT03]SKC53178.1 monosaccharide ABC transporter ATP-binding protein, CUT2 family [Paraburkholderia hospita]SOE87443.1 monosaccharide ABC transporter ATP-binding protein, CUT2 family [Burkholderia sp. YR290]
METMTSASPVPRLELRKISKSFPGVRALSDVDLQLYPGEVHMLLGENGAGKSSLMKVLFGAYRADAGEFFFDGEPVAIGSPADAKRLGIAVIFQEFSLVPHLSIAQNIYLGREPRNRFGLVDHRRMHADAAAVLGELGLAYDTRMQAVELGVAQQQMVEIAKALSHDARVLVMDEPTAAISDREADALFAVVHRLRDAGVAIVYISHRMKEVFDLGDRVTVLRDGRLVKSMLASDTKPDELIALMVGRSVGTAYQRRYVGKPGDMALEVKQLRTATGVNGVDLYVRCGEIVGLSGLVGAGRSEVVRAVFGADPIQSGRVEIFGEEVSGGPHKVAARGVGLIPENRKQEGLALTRSVHENLLAASLWRLFPKGFYRVAQAKRATRELIDSLRIAPGEPAKRAQFLSGGNQQKIVIGKWLSAGCRLFIFDEPTRGIDIGAKTEIFALIERLVEEGAAVLLISSELSEIVHVCDRAYVMREGTISGELPKDQLSERNILALAMHEEA